MFPELRLSGGLPYIPLCYLFLGRPSLVAGNERYLESPVDTCDLAAENLTVDAEARLPARSIQTETCRTSNRFPFVPRALVFLCLEDDLTAFLYL